MCFDFSTNLSEIFLILSRIQRDIIIMYVFFWVFPRRLMKIAVCRRFGTLYQFHLQRLDVRYEDGGTSLCINFGTCV